jgi:aspartate kinase
MKIKPLRIEKIGGTSMSAFDKIIDNVILYDPNDIYNRIYVVSAYGGITNDLLEHKKTGKTGIYSRFVKNRDYRKAMRQFKKKLFEINRGFAPIGLNADAADDFISGRIDKAIDVLDSMKTVLSSGYVNRGELLLSARELLASLGEMHSAFNSANILQNRGYRAEFIDLSGWKDGHDYTIDGRIRDAFKAVDPATAIGFATGYTKGTEGIMREFDRGYSEVTFSKIAVQLKAREAIIHKEFHLCSGDPAIIGYDVVRPVGNTNFDVADQLADVDMEAIHPKASKALKTAGIPIRVKNAFEPDHPGTLITKKFINPTSKVEIVTGSDHVTSVRIHDTRMVGAVGFDLKIMQVFDRHHVSYICKMTNANTIEMVIKDTYYSKTLLHDLKKEFEEVTVLQVAIVCAIGSNIDKPGIMAKAANALAHNSINILGISHTTQQTNMQFIISRSDFIKAQKALHHALCEN